MHATDEAFSPQAAARELHALSSFEHVLRQRSEGVLWMVMGLVAATLFLAYTLVSMGGGRSPAVYGVLWTPFVGAGAAIVWGMRRSLALDAPRAMFPEVWLVAALGLAMLPVAFAAFTQERDAAPALALVGISVVAALPAMISSLGFTPLGRRVALALGGWGVFAGVMLLALHAPVYVGAWVGGSTTLLWIAAGLWETLQG
jgi:hypothetical protein